MEKRKRISRKEEKNPYFCILNYHRNLYIKKPLLGKSKSGLLFYFI